MDFKKLALSSLLVLSTAVQADQIGWGELPTQPGQQNPGRPNRPNKPEEPARPQPQRPDQPSRPPVEPNQPTYPDFGGRDPWEEERRDYSREVELRVGQYFYNQSRLDLVRDSYIRSQLQGRRIKEVRITASTEQGNGVARLLANGQAFEQGQTVARQMYTYTFRVDSFSDTLGQSLRSLELEMRGRFYVEKAVFIVAENDGPSYPGPGYPSQVEVVRQQLNESIQGEGGLQLSRVFNLAERQGQALRRVTVIARSFRGASQGSLLINDQTTGYAQTIGAGATRLTFETHGQKIGREIQGLRLYFRGNVTIDEVSLEFDKFSQGPGPIQERRLEQVINQRIYETNGIKLRDLMRIDRRHEERVVESVELYLRGSDYGARVKLCQEVFGRYESETCGQIQTLSPGAQVVRLSSVNFAKLSELSLSVRMGMIDLDRIIINLR